MKRLLSINALLIGATGAFIVILLAIFALVAVGAFDRSQRASDTLAIVSLKRSMFSAWDCVRTELGRERAAYSDSRLLTGIEIQQIVALHELCDKRIVSLIAGLRAKPTALSTASIAQVEKRHALYRAVSSEVLRSIKYPLAERHKSKESRWTTAVDSLSAELDRQSKALSNRIGGEDATVRELLSINDIAWNIRADAGVDRRYMGDALRKESPSLNLRLLDKLQGRIHANWATLNGSMNTAVVPPEMSDALTKAHSRYFKSYLTWRDEIVSQLARGDAITMTRQELLDKSGEGIDSLADVSSLALNLTERRAVSAASTARWNLIFAVSALLISIVVTCAAGGYFMRRVILPLQQLTRTMKEVAGGQLEQRIPFEDRNDEIGQFARTLREHRDGALSRQGMEIEMVKSEAARQVAETANRTKSEFLANMSHELRTPLNAILGFSEIISSETYGPGDLRYRAYAKDIYGAGAHLLSLINDILDISKAEAGKMELSLEEVDLAETVSECVRLMRCRAEQHDLQLFSSVKAIPKLTVDRLRTKQVVLNVLSNAIKFTPEGGRVSVETQIDDYGNTIVSVSDTGIGIAPEMISVAFEPFRQIDSALSRKFEGTGLGLSLVKTLMELQGGVAELESAIGVGTTVRLKFPSRAASAVKATAYR